MHKKRLEKPPEIPGEHPEEAQTVGRASVRVKCGVHQLSFFLPYLEYQRRDLRRILPGTALKVAWGHIYLCEY